MSAMPAVHRRRVAGRTVQLVAASLLSFGYASGAAAATFTVNVTGDADDASPGDGICRSTAGPGTCSLRAAITEANARSGHDIIAFAIGSGVQTIMPATALPTISDPVTIDGTTQPGFTDHPLIEVNGEITLSIGFLDGLVITAGDTTIRGLVINTFGFDGIRIIDGGNNVITGNYIGTNVPGTFSGTDFANGGTGIDIFDSANNRIGGTTPAERNLISGNGLDGLNGISIQGSDSIANVIQGNLIGPDITGTVSLGNQVGGIIISDAGDTLIGGTDPGAGNVVSGNGQGGNGITVAGTATGTVIQGNLVGTDVTGTHGLGNSANGININADDNLVGGTTPAARNIISGNNLPFTNTGSGVILGSSAQGNRIQGNYIGTDITGSFTVGEQEYGVRIDGGDENVVGGTEPGAGNVISGHQEEGVHLSGDDNVVQGNLIGTDQTGLHALGNCFGVLIAGYRNLLGGTTAAARNIIAASSRRGVEIFAEPGASSNRVQGNYIGTDITGLNLLGNVEVGVRIDHSAANVIGGSQPGAGNLIAGNGDGIYLGDSTIVGCSVFTPPGDESIRAPLANGLTTIQGNTIESNDGRGIVVDGGSGNRILGNLMSGNAIAGIDLGKDGVTANDPMDADAGANGLQNYPVLLKAIRSGPTTRVRGVLTSAPSAQYKLQFFASSSCHPSGHGEGERLLGSKSVSTDASGFARFAAAFAVPVAPGSFLTATATDAGGNTSEFSACVAAVPGS